MTVKKPIQITVNGQSATLEDQTPIPAFLESRDINPERVVVEWNGQAKTRSESAQIALSAGDSLEVVRIVAGG